jgi:hypothetical protein
MDSNVRKIFELDEPAAKSHTPPGGPIRTIEIEPSGNASKNYGLVECLVVILHDCLLAMMIDLAIGSLSRRFQ